MKQVLILAVIIGSFTSCHHVTGSGNIVSEKRQTGDFKGIETGGSFEVELKTGPTSVEISCDDNLVKYVETKLINGVLHLNTRNRLNISNGHLKAYISAPEINSIRCSGAASVKAMDLVKTTGKLELEASGAGNIKAEVDAPEIEAEASGAANIELTGRTKNYSANASGGASLKTKNLKSENTDAEVSGAATAHVHASVSLKADASGAGNIYYNGGGTVERKTSGAGNVKAEE